MTARIISVDRAKRIIDTERGLFSPADSFWNNDVQPGGFFQHLDGKDAYLCDVMPLIPIKYTYTVERPYCLICGGPIDFYDIYSNCGCGLRNYRDDTARDYRDPATFRFYTFEVTEKLCESQPEKK